MKYLMILMTMLFVECQENYKGEKCLQKMEYGEVSDTVTLELGYIGYACGECVPNYNVLKVIFSKNDNYSYYFNKEIHLDIVNKDLEQKIETKISNLRVGQNYKYIVTGKFRRNGFGIGKLEAFEADIKTE